MTYHADEIKDRARQMRREGATLRAIAAELDSNRTTIGALCWDIPHPKRPLRGSPAWRPRGKHVACWECGAALSEYWQDGRFCGPCRFARAQHSGRAAAGQAVSKAIRDGALPHPTTLTCADCSRQAEEYDHRDYSKPLDVAAVCRKCNARRGPGKWVQFKPVREMAAERASLHTPAAIAAPAQEAA